MKSALVFLALVALTQGVSHLKADGRIVDREDVSLGEIPYQVSLQNQVNSHICGGSVLNKNYVITTARCLEKKTPRDIKIVAGTTNLQDPQSIHSVARIIIHADYNPADSWTNDIALVKVSKEFDFSETLWSVPLPEKSLEVTTGSVGFISGWGNLVNSGDTPVKLRVTDVRIADQSYCNGIYGGIGYPIYGTHICAYNQTVTPGSCVGDIGGPLTVDGKLVGLGFWPESCGSFEYPTVYTRVSEYIDWINSHTVPEQS